MLLSDRWRQLLWWNTDLNKSQNIFNNWKVLRHGLLPSLVLLTTSTLQCNAYFFNIPGQVSLRALALAIPTVWNTFPLDTSRAHSSLFFFFLNLSLYLELSAQAHFVSAIYLPCCCCKTAPPPSTPASFSLMCAQSFSHVRLFATSWTVACQTLPSVHGIFQARILEWVAIPFSGGSSWPRDRTCISCVSCNGRQILDCCATWKVPLPPHRQFDFSPWGLLCTSTVYPSSPVFRRHIVLFTIASSAPGTILAHSRHPSVVKGMHCRKALWINK